jgi:ubiquinone/menaquinone biosynthesis C-methylase UbiE
MWANGTSYEYYIGRWSRLVAWQFVAWLDISSGARWLDAVCGTGILSQTILDVASPQIVLGIDSSEGYIEFAHKQVIDPRVSFRLGDAQALPVESGSYDAAVSGLALNFIPSPSQAVTEMVRYRWQMVLALDGDDDGELICWVYTSNINPFLILVHDCELEYL